MPALVEEIILQLKSKAKTAKNVSQMKGYMKVL